MSRFALVLLTFAMPLGAGDFDPPVPPMPPDGLLDQARLFSRAPEEAASLGTRLREFHERTGFRVGVAIMDVMIGYTLPEEARRLCDAWVGDDPGLVLVLEADSGHWSLSWSERTIRAEGHELPAIGPSEVPPEERVRIESHLRGLPEPRVRSREDAARFVEVLLAELEPSVGTQGGSGGYRGRLLLLAAGLGSALLLVAMLIGAAVRRADRRARDRLYFPGIEVGRRLRAPRGGGKVSSRSFDVSA